MQIDFEYRSRYFDNAATTPLDPRVLEEMLPFYGDAFGNANSIHEPGRRAQAAVELARDRVANLLGADSPEQIIFTSGATEANNWILSSFAAKGGAVSPFEHSSVRETAQHFRYAQLENKGYELSSWDGPGLLSVMAVNNETGARFHPEGHRHGSGISIHSDVTQQVGKLDFELSGVQYASFSGHKFYGPKGIGGLWMAFPDVDPLLFGGEHEHGLRSGTLNVPGIVGMGCAAELAAQEKGENLHHAEILRALVLAAVEKVPDVQLNSPPGSSPYIVSLSFLNVEGETLVVELDRAGFSISSGAACSTQSTEPSHVLTALGLDENWIRGTIRISFGKYNTEATTASLAKELCATVEKLRTMH